MDPSKSEPITFSEYEAAYRRFVSCLREQGVGVTEHGLTPHTHQFEYATEGNDEVERATGRAPDAECYEREFAEADMQWQHQTAEDYGDVFNRTLAFFSSLGLTDVPEEFSQPGHLGALVMLASSELGGSVVHEYIESEFDLDNRRRMRALGSPPSEPDALK